MINSSSEIYQVLEKALREASSPLTCSALMDIGYVREAAVNEYGEDVQFATNKLSDALGFMWRRDAIERYQAPRGGSTKARYAYAWPKEKKSLVPVPSPQSGKRPSFEIIESESCVTIEFEEFKIVVRKR